MPRAADAQGPRKIYRIGVLNAERFPPSADPRVPFFVKLRELGWVDGQTVAIKEVYADGDLQRLPALAADLVNSGVDVIVAWGGTPPTLAAKQATQTIPIVFPSAGEPVAKGLVASLAHPGGNVTGIANYDGYGKQFEVLKEAVPKVSRVAFLHNPAAFGSAGYLTASLAALQSQASGLHLTVQPVAIQSPDETDRVFAALASMHPDGAYVDDVPATVSPRAHFCGLALRQRLPVISRNRVFPDAGCLLSYGEHLGEKWRQAASLVDKILKGAKPSDLPVEQVVRFEMILNLKTAKALGLTIPQSVLMRADEVIQ
jgi:putative tryptophan/tyrosine transport system substrate-binding protein